MVRLIHQVTVKLIQSLINNLWDPFAYQRREQPPSAWNGSLFLSTNIWTAASELCMWPFTRCAFIYVSPLQQQQVAQISNHGWNGLSGLFKLQGFPWQCWTVVGVGDWGGGLLVLKPTDDMTVKQQHQQSAIKIRHNNTISWEHATLFKALAPINIWRPTDVSA